MLAREEASSEGAKNAWMPPEGPRKPVAGFFRPSGILMPPEGKRRSTGLKTAFPCTGKKYPPFGNKKSPLEGPKKLKIGGRAVIVRPQSGLDFYFSGWGGGGNSPPSAGIPRQVWYVVTKAVRKALKRWGALAGLIGWLLVLCQLVLANINLDRSDYYVIVTVSLRGSGQCCVMSHRAIAGI